MRAKILLLFSAVLIPASILIDFLLIPSKTGNIAMQFNPIFYLHIPVAWIALLGFLIVFIAGIAYLRTRHFFWDNVGSAAAELGVVFTTLFLLTGSIWGKSEWGVWWTWEPRLTSSLVLWVIYVAYLLLRAYVSEPEQRARYSAAFGIIGFIDVPIVILTLFAARKVHPGDVAFQLDQPQMIAALATGVVAFSVLFLALLFIRTHLKEDENEVKRLKSLSEEIVND
jgi:heme exporter protein C